MTKAEVVEKMAKDAGISKTAAGTALNSFVDTVTKALKKKDGRVTLVGFGTFSKVRRKSAQGQKSSDRRNHQNQGFQCGKVQAGESLERLNLVQRF